MPTPSSTPSPDPGSPTVPIKINIGTENPLVAILQRQHADYKELIKLWKQYQAVYVGGDDMKAFLIKHAREHVDAFAARKKRAFYFNYVKQIVDLFVSYLFRKEISRETRVPDIEAFWSNADGSSEGIEHPVGNILKEAAVFYLLFGKVAIVVDMPPASGEVSSVQDKKDQGLDPYIYLVKPQNLIDWQYGEDGKLDWVRFEESIPVPMDAFEPRKGTKRWKYTTWDREKWTKHIIEEDKEGSKDVIATETTEGAHPLGRVPVVIVQKNDNFKFGSSSGISLIADISVSSVALYNLGSITGEEFYNHALNILVMQKQTSEEDSEDIVLSRDNVLEYDIGANPPSFLAPSSVPVESLQGFMQKIIEEMKRMSRLGSTDSSLTGTGNQTSGLAAAFSFSDSNQALADTAQLLQEIETRLVTLVTLWLGKDPETDLEDTKILYPTDFGLSLFDDELATVSTATQVVQSKTFAKVITKRVAVKFLDKETPEVVKQVAEEIEAAIDAQTDQPEAAPGVAPVKTSSGGRTSQIEGSSDDKSSSGSSTTAGGPSAS